MIDYEKLKEAHELARKLTRDGASRIDVYVSIYYDDEPMYGLIGYNSSKEMYESISIDDIIAKLNELNSHCTECYKEAIEVVKEGRLPPSVTKKIADKLHKHHEIVLQYQDNPVYEKVLKPWIDYFKDKDLAEKCGLEVKDICQHESDNNFHAISKENGFYIHSTVKCDFPPGFQATDKCKKCGEFY